MTRTVNGTRYLARKAFYCDPSRYSAMKSYTSIDIYIADYPKPVQKMLRELRTYIHKLAPKATEKMSYGIPTFELQGNLVHFAAYASHIGFYPGASGIKHFQKELAAYSLSKGTVRFPLDHALPFGLIRRIVLFRVKENAERAKLKAKRKK